MKRTLAMRIMHRFIRHTLFTLALGSGVALSHSARAQIITDLFNTGVDASGAPLATNGVADSHYTNITTPPGTTFTTANGNYHSYTDAGYITVDQAGGNGSYTATFNTAFTLPANAVLSTVSIGGNYSIDNTLVDILINGHSTGINNNNISNFTGANPFTLPTGFYQAGSNTLGITWNDLSGPGAIAFEFTNKSFAIGASGVPEPGSIALLVGLGVPGSLFGVSRLRRRHTTAT
jgi:hypothetical protein